MQFLNNERTMVKLLNAIIGLFIGISYQHKLVSSTEAATVFQYQFPSVQIDSTNSLSRNEFPENFSFGLATTNYLMGPDGRFHRGHFIGAKKNINEYSDFNSKYKEDIRLAKSLGSKMYKFSLSWSKILPNGFVNHVNQGQLNYYDRMIDEILANDMKPMVTLYHGELPDRIRQLGGWTNPLIIDWFVDYAQLVFMSFAYKVKFWVTVHEPTILCTLVLENSIPNQSGIADYLCGHHTLLAHAKAYHLYHEKFGHERGKIGITHLYTWLEADNPESSVDIEAVERAYQWYNNWLTHPVFSENGDYPHLMKRIVSEKSLLAFYRSRLPSFTQSEIDQVKGSADFVGINFYSASKVRGINPDPNDISFENDAAFQQTDSWPKESWTKSTPWALKKFLHRFNNEYLLPEIYVTQNGFIDNGDILDLGRCVYFREYILEILKAMKGGVDIRGYLAWSLVDEYEWKLNNNGSSGLFHVDLKDLMLLRTNKLSTKVLAYIYKNRVVDHMTKMLGNSWLELIYS